MSNSAYRFLRTTWMATIVLLLASHLAAQQQRERQRPQGQRTEESGGGQDGAATREGGIPREMVDQQGGQSDEGTEDGMPRLRARPGDQRVAPQFRPPHPRSWRLGVFAHNTDTGVVVTRVVAGSAAARVGLEQGDRIVAVTGFQVGWVQDRLYPLGSELERHAGRRGEVRASRR